jgi:hypothetical protein
MSKLRRLLVTVAVVAAAPVRADPVDDQVARGEELGRQGAWTQAIDHFKQADRLAPRARHACLIGLAYARRELWAEAELYFALCHRRATPADPLPPWLADAETQLGQKLAASNAAAITITVEPPEATPQISVSSFAPDERFPPRTIHLAPGTHVLTIAAPGYETERREVVVTDPKPQAIAVTLHEPRERSHVPLYVIAAGIAIALGGVAYDRFVVQPTRDRYDTAMFQWQYDQAKADFAGQQRIAIGLFAAAGVVAVTGIVLRYTVYRHGREPVRVGAILGHGTAGIAVEWLP